MPSPDFPIRGEFHELPGNPPDLEARRQAFRAVMRRLLATPRDDDRPDDTESDGDSERDAA